jgi:hypothetical protein
VTTGAVERAWGCEVMSMFTDPNDFFQVDALFDAASHEDRALEELNGALVRLKRARDAKVELTRLGAQQLRRHVLWRQARDAGRGVE